MCYEDALPTGPGQLEQAISDNDIDNTEFSKELPFEREYYRTSTDRDDEFIRPIPNPEENEIDDGDDGIELDAPGAHTPECTYVIVIKLFDATIEDLRIKLNGLSIESESKSNVSLDEFLQQSRVHIVDMVRGKNLTNEIINDIINYQRQQFVNVFGYEDDCGVSTSIFTCYMTNDTQSDEIEDEQTTELPSGHVLNDAKTSDVEILAKTNAETTGTVGEEEDVTEEYEVKTLTRPKLSEIVQDTINAYRALNNWRYSQQS